MTPNQLGCGVPHADPHPQSENDLAAKVWGSELLPGATTFPAAKQEEEGREGA